MSRDAQERVHRSWAERGGEFESDPIPTGQMIHGDELRKWVADGSRVGRDIGAGWFYSRYVYATPPPGHLGADCDAKHSGDPLPAHGQGVSGARYV